LSKLIIKTPEWAEPLLYPKRYKGAKGGRGSGKSHFFAESLVEALVIDPNKSAVCIREIQKSLKFSAKRLIEQKIEDLKVSHLFNITQTEIRTVNGKGIILFQGMQDHTADSIKSLEGFDIAWVEEAQNLSARSLQLLRPTIRKEGSEIWFSWNPTKPTDPVDAFFQNKYPDMICVHVNSEQNPFLPETLRKERDADRIRMSPEDYDHVWNGAYNEKSDALVFKGKYEVDDFEPQEDWTRLQGLDWGFSQDPTAAVEIYATDNTLYIRREAGKVGLELDETVPFILQTIPDFDKYTIRADNSRPESISHVKRKGFSKIKGEPKLKIEEGINFMRNFDRIVIHPDCKETIKEFGLYSYKIDMRSGDILPVIVDKNNNYIDAIRYALYPLITKRGEAKVRSTTKTSYHRYV
jgi:phage terminase large subunit